MASSVGTAAPPQPPSFHKSGTLHGQIIPMQVFAPSGQSISHPPEDAYGIALIGQRDLMSVFMQGEGFRKMVAAHSGAARAVTSSKSSMAL